MGIKRRHWNEGRGRKIDSGSLKIKAVRSTTKDKVPMTLVGCKHESPSCSALLLLAVADKKTKWMKRSAEFERRQKPDVWRKCIKKKADTKNVNFRGYGRLGGKWKLERTREWGTYSKHGCKPRMIFLEWNLERHRIKPFCCIKYVGGVKKETEFVNEKVSEHEPKMRKRPAVIVIVLLSRMN